MLWPVREIHNALEQFQPDLIHLHDPLQLADITIAYARKVKIPIILTIHAHPGLVTSMLPENSFLQGIAEQSLWAIATHLRHKVSAWITPTQTNARLVEKHTSINPHVISNGIDLEDFPSDPLPRQLEKELKNHLRLPVEARILLHVGRLDPGKNVAMVIEAASQVIKGNLSKNIHLLVVGDGIEKHALQKQTESLGISDKSRFPGYIREKEILSAVYRCSELFLMASTIETQGIVLLEAAASGLPIVAVNATAIPEIVVHGFNGFLVQPGDLKTMAQHISEILSDGSLSDRMRLAGRQIALQHDFEKSVDAHERIYLCVINSARYAENNLSSTRIIANK